MQRISLVHSLTLTTLIIASFTLFGQKRPLTHQDYDSWKSIQSPQLSRDGKWAAYALMPQDGDGEVIVHNLATGAEWKSPRGYRPPVPPPDPSDPGAAQVNFAMLARMVRPVFTADSRFLVFTIEPTKAELLKAKKEKRKPEDLPKNALGLMDLNTGVVTRLEKVKTFQVPEDGIGWLAYQLEARPDEKKTEEKIEPKPSDEEAADWQGTRGQRGAALSPRTKKKEFGSDLILRNLLDGKERTFNDVLDFAFSKDAKTLIYTVSAKKDEANGVYAATPGNDGPPVELLSGKGRYTKLTWDEEQTQLAFVSDRDDTAAKQPIFKLYHWKRGSEGKASELVARNTSGFRPEFVIADRANLNFSVDGNELFLSVAPPPEPEKDPESEDPSEEKVLVDLWHYKDDYIQPMQKVRVELDRGRAYRAVYHFKEKKFVQLADDTMEIVIPANRGNWAIGTDDRGYRSLIGREANNLSDIFLVNTLDGSRKALLQKNQFGVTWSPNGKFALYFDGKDWNTISVPDGKVTNLTAKLGGAFWREDTDTPSTPSGYGTGGWTRDEKYVLLYDKYDIWQVTPDGSAAKNLTDGVGRKEKIEFRYVRLDAERGTERGIDSARPLLLSAENSETHDSGFYRDRIDGGLPEKLVMAAKSYTPPIKAKDADVFLLTASRFDEYPDLLTTNSSFQDFKKISNAGEQTNKFLWGTSELVHYKNTDGVPLSGVLIKPDNFDPNKKYPMIVYLYEKLSQEVNRFTPPSPGTSINRTFYASNGYLVLMPDIVYTIGYPGQSALKCVLPAVQAVVDKGFVDENAIGIQGHSWGGYQIAYMVTQTNRFKAAAPGALVANMTSAYSGIRWGTGLSRQFQYEHTQSRIGGSLWEYPMRYLENSPVFRADRVQTPILMIANDNDDAVPWYQGIEFYLALRRLGKEVYMFSYNGEFHGLRRRPDQKDYTRRLQEYFDHYLKGAPSPEWMEKGIPYLQREKEKEKYKTDSDGK